MTGRRGVDRSRLQRLVGLSTADPSQSEQSQEPGGQDRRCDLQSPATGANLTLRRVQLSHVPIRLHGTPFAFTK